MQSPAAPPPPPTIATITGGGYAVPIASAVALLSEAPALLTRYTPPPGCATDWYWDIITASSGAAAAPPPVSSGSGAQEAQSSVIYSDRAHNGEGWATCQPYRVAARATYSAGVCPDRSAFATVSKVTRVPGPEDAFYLGACCATIKTGTRAYLETVLVLASRLTWTLQNCHTVGVPGERQRERQRPGGDPVRLRRHAGERDGDALARRPPLRARARDGDRDGRRGALYMVWREGDLALHAESDANSLRAAMGMDAAVTSPTAEPSPIVTLAPPKPRSSFPAGAVAGIVAGFVVCVLAISFLGFVAFSRKGEEVGRTTEERG
ncbi:hypothetical protein PG997_015070 [Apiospora hydei]|uniref:Uncharacterized protein n=1 Tax=Apiospora hydei TaxID=1337664 RepID=A0ABR1UYV1_9PEZI